MTMSSYEAHSREWQQLLDAQDERTMFLITRQWEVSARQIETQLAASLAQQRVLDSRIFEDRRMANLLVQINNQINGSLEDAGSLMEVMLKDAGVLGSRMASDLMNAVVPGAFSALPTNQVNRAVGMLDFGTPMQEELHKVAGLTTIKLQEQILANIAQGKSARQIAQAAKAHGLDQGLNDLLTISRDVSNRAFRETAIETYKRSGVVRSFKRLAAKNDRTCHMCLALDGEVISVEKAFDLALHWQDRCTVVPVVEGFPEPTWQTGAEWFDEQPEGVQRKILGKTALQKYHEGVPLRQMFKIENDPSWGKRLVPSPVHNVVKMKGLSSPVPSSPPSAAIVNTSIHDDIQMRYGIKLDDGTGKAMPEDKARILAEWMEQHHVNTFRMADDIVWPNDMAEFKRLLGPDVDNPENILGFYRNRHTDGQFVRQIVLNPSKPLDTIHLTFDHEAGHSILRVLPDDITQSWSIRYNDDPTFDRLTDYAKTNASEGFCETYMAYLALERQSDVDWGAINVSSQTQKEAFKVLREVLDGF